MPLLDFSLVQHSSAVPFGVAVARWQRWQRHNIFRFYVTAVSKMTRPTHLTHFRIRTHTLFWQLIYVYVCLCKNSTSNNNNKHSRETSFVWCVICIHMHVLSLLLLLPCSGSYSVICRLSLVCRVCGRHVVAIMCGMCGKCGKVQLLFLPRMFIAHAAHILSTTTTTTTTTQQVDSFFFCLQFFISYFEARREFIFLLKFYSLLASLHKRIATYFNTFRAVIKIFIYIFTALHLSSHICDCVVERRKWFVA